MKVVVKYTDGTERVVYEGEDIIGSMRVQAEWVKKAHKNNDILSVEYK